MTKPLISAMLLMSIGCTDKTEPEENRTCGNTDAPTVALGRGVGGAFEPLTDLQQVGLAIAPQGGFGVEVQVRTGGLIGDTPATVTVSTFMDDANTGDFTFIDDAGEPTLQLFCLDDGMAAVGTGVTVGFDPSIWTQDNLTDLDGQQAELVVTVVDEAGTEASGSATVTLVVGG